MEDRHLEGEDTQNRIWWFLRVAELVKYKSELYELYKRVALPRFVLKHKKKTITQVIKKNFGKFVKFYG